MTITLIGSGGLFTRLGKNFHAQNTLNTARGTTVPTEVNDYLIEFDNVSNDMQAVLDGIPSAITGANSGQSGLVNALNSSAQKLVVQMVKDDVQLPSYDLTSCLKEIIRQMGVSSDDVDASTVGASVAAGSGNNGDGALVYSTKRGDGLTNENIVDEAIVFECTSDSTEGSESFTAKGETAAASALGSDWPLGSGCNRTVTAVDAGSASANLLLNGSFEDEEDLTNSPDDWETPVATIGTTLKLTDPEVQTVILSGTPTSGTYSLRYTNPSSKVQDTERLAYNASGGAVQTALRKLAGLASVEVATTGTSPNFTHTITFYGPDNGNLTTLSSINNLDTGSIAHAQVTAGSAFVYKGAKALEFDSDGAQLTVIQQRVESKLEALAQYACNMWMLADVVPAAGVIRVSLWDGSAVINDAQGTANSFTQACASLTTSYVAKNGVFRTPRVMPPVVYFRIEITTAISGGTSVFVDNCALKKMDALYNGGPEVALFSGAARFRKGGEQQTPDKFTLTATNNRAGAMQEQFDRNFAMRDKGLLLPSDTGGTETVLDSLIG